LHSMVSVIMLNAIMVSVMMPFKCNAMSIKLVTNWLNFSVS
jgi:hypothetical protein